MGHTEFFVVYDIQDILSWLDMIYRHMIYRRKRRKRIKESSRRRTCVHATGKWRSRNEQRRVYVRGSWLAKSNMGMPCACATPLRDYQTTCTYRGIPIRILLYLCLINQLSVDGWIDLCLWRRIYHDQGHIYPAEKSQAVLTCMHAHVIRKRLPWLIINN
jgi:hypothetical protein